MRPDEFRFGIADRVAALRSGADALQARYPSTQCDVVIWLHVNRRNAHARWCWPGVVRVTVRETGQLIAQSHAGKPYQLDRRVSA